MEEYSQVFKQNAYSGGIEAITIKCKKDGRFVEYKTICLNGKIRFVRANDVIDPIVVFLGGGTIGAACALGIVALIGVFRRPLA